MSDLAVSMNEGFGRWVDGILDAQDIQTRELAQTAGMHESEISRIRNARKQADFKQIFQMGRGFGRLETRRAKK